MCSRGYGLTTALAARCRVVCASQGDCYIVVAGLTMQDDDGFTCTVQGENENMRLQNAQVSGLSGTSVLVGAPATVHQVVVAAARDSQTQLCRRKLLSWLCLCFFQVMMDFAKAILRESKQVRPMAAQGKQQGLGRGWVSEGQPAVCPAGSGVDPEARTARGSEMWIVLALLQHSTVQ